MKKILLVIILFFSSAIVKETKCLDLLSDYPLSDALSDVETVLSTRRPDPKLFSSYYLPEVSNSQIEILNSQAQASNSQGIIRNIAIYVIKFRFIFFIYRLNSGQLNLSGNGTEDFPYTNNDLRIIHGFKVSGVINILLGIMLLWNSLKK